MMCRQFQVYRRHSRTAIGGCFVFLAALGLVRAAGTDSPPGLRGLPFTRTYPMEEVGNVPRGARLSFDRFGRLAVVYDGIYAVLNDTTWLDLADKSSPEGLPLVTQGTNGQAFYAGFGTWGKVQVTSNGTLRPQPLTPADPPKWALTMGFKDLAITEPGVFFGGWNGVVYWDFATQKNHFFEILRYSILFSLGDEVYVASFGQPIQRIDVAGSALRSIDGTNLGEDAIAYATKFDATHALVATRDGQIYLFDGKTLTPWSGQLRNGLTGRVTSMQHLLDGGVAIAISGKGLFILSDEGELVSALTSPEYHRITQLATREPGVLWSTGEDGIQKLLYGSPLTIFGQRLGLVPSWPMVSRWNDTTIVASSGRLYQAVAGAEGSASRFEPMTLQPAAGAWTVAAQGPHLLLGNGNGAFSAERDGSFTAVAPNMDVARLAMIEGDTCFAIGRGQIAALKWSDGQWTECAPRVPTVGYPSVVHRARHSVWVELGAHRVARVTLREGKIRTQVFEDFPWKDGRWINVGIVDDTVVLTGSPGNRRYFDEVTESFVSAPKLQQLLDRSPTWIVRIQKDEAGTLWATHDEGVVTFTPQGDTYRMDTTTFDLNNEHYPVVQLLPGNDVWLSTGQSLYHVDRNRGFAASETLRPIMISVADARTSAELLTDTRTLPKAFQLPYSRNSVNFRFFTGSYAWRRAPVYEFRLGSHQNQWTSLGTGSLLTFPRLREGNYHLEVRVANAQGPIGEPVSLDFEILPPWFRTWPAYVLYGFGLALLLVVTVRWSLKRTYRRNVALEKIVRQRTEQLKATMQKLNDETRNAATLAERDRLAGEIHDSLQQGLSGLMLQLDATLKLPSLTGDLRSRLNVARNMVSFTRQEVQHAVWDMESPLLQDTELGEALRKITGLIGSGDAKIEVAVSGPPIPLPSSTQHHLLRIAQEAITNAVRHASPRHIAVRLDYRSDTVELRITDDGVGFQPDDVLTNAVGHFGLRGLRGRTNKMGAELRIESSPGRGATVEVVVSLAVPADLAAHAVTSSN